MKNHKTNVLFALLTAVCIAIGINTYVLDESTGISDFWGDRRCLTQKVVDPGKERPKWWQDPEDGTYYYYYLSHKTKKTYTANPQSSYGGRLVGDATGFSLINQDPEEGADWRQGHAFTDGIRPGASAYRDYFRDFYGHSPPVVAKLVGNLWYYYYYPGYKSKKIPQRAGESI